MRRLQPSLVRRVTLAFVLGPFSAIVLLMIGIRPLLADLDNANVGPEIALSILSADIKPGVRGSLALRPRSDIVEFASRTPIWFIAMKKGGELRFGPIPQRARELLSGLPNGIKYGHFANVGAAGRRGDATLDMIDTEAGPIAVLLGGVDPKALNAKTWLLYAHRDEETYMGFVFVLIVCMTGGPIAIPIILLSVRPTARAAAALSSSDFAVRLPEKGVVRELLPIVRAFNGALDRLASAFERRRRFIADLAHELRTPMAVLNMHVEAMPDGGRKPDLQRTVFRVGQMVGQMLDAERLALGTRQRRPIDLVEVVRTAAAEIAPLAVASGYQLSFSPPRKKVVVYGDAHAIGRAVTNLMGNAVAHGGGTGLIRVSVSEDRRVEVADQGAGIPIEARERIFEPFRRERWDRDGCGLGLHLVSEIMRAHGGAVRLVSADPGAVFRLEFPKADEAMAREEPSV